MADLILALDQGTTSTRAVVFDVDGWRARATAQIPLEQHFPHPGSVEHDADEIWRAALQVCREAMHEVGGPDHIAAIGLTNQRETTLLWDRATGAPLHRAIVWQDRRTAPVTDALKAAGHEPVVQAETGLVLDPYFSASKIAWLLDHVDGARARAEAGELCAGTIDAWLMFKLTGGARFVTDVTNASRTSLFGLSDLTWRDDLLDLFNVPRSVLPEVLPSADLFGETVPDLFGRAIPITGCAGDQQAALVGHGGLGPGAIKVTYGTGAFLVAHTGDRPVASTNRLLSTVAYRVDGQTAYALEGSIFSAGSTIQWLRDVMGAVGHSRESETVAQSLLDNGGVYLVPAFTGLGAPIWEAEARGAIFGLTRDAGPAHIVRAGLEAMAYQTHDLLEALKADGAPAPRRLRVDGGVTANGWLMQFLADITACEVERPAHQEMTALGAARLAALGCGLIETLEQPPSGQPAVWSPAMADAERTRLLAGWDAAVAGCLAQARAGRDGANH
ncbi:glycerol kinase GlpK [Brevundimonas aveniformis]|uniref:glycerol kinase GlpK n=1 Tax=Brevundimonas aveniformis TaxID=370977 RepID=UPI002493833D|nr:glycerol kinase GlpK [Brevundimonas aveniformis]